MATSKIKYQHSLTVSIFMMYCVYHEGAVISSNNNPDVDDKETNIEKKHANIKIERVDSYDDGLWWKSRVIIACTVIAALEIIIVLLMIAYWRQIRYYFTKINCPCDNYLYERRLRRQMLRDESHQETTNVTQPERNINLSSELNTLQPVNDDRLFSEDDTENRINFIIHRAIDVDLERSYHSNQCSTVETFQDKDNIFQINCNGSNKNCYSNLNFLEDAQGGESSQLLNEKPTCSKY